MSDELIGTARGIVDAFNASDWEGFQNLMTEDAVYDEVGTSRTIEGIEPIIEAMKGWKEAMPDVKGTVDNAAATDSGVVLEVTWRGGVPTRVPWPVPRDRFRLPERPRLRGRVG